MKSRPILFSAPMVRALLAGTKTQTRRVLKPQTDARPYGWGTAENGEPAAALKCPYGRAGDQLWVKETYAVDKRYDRLKPTEFPNDAEVWFLADGPKRDYWGRTRVSIHMTRRLSRLTLVIESVRVERLQDITVADAVAEGVEPVALTWANYGRDRMKCFTARDSYRSLWENINGEDSWTANPWVWVVSFKRVP